MNQEMTTEQALQILDQVAASFQGTRLQHLQMQRAVEILAEYIKGDQPTQVEV